MPNQPYIAPGGQTAYRKSDGTGAELDAFVAHFKEEMVRQLLGDPTQAPSPTGSIMQRLGHMINQNSTPSLPATLQVSRRGTIDLKEALAYNFPGKRVGSFGAAMTDIVEFPLTGDRIPILDGTVEVRLSSSSNNDNSAGTGVRSVEVVYLDETYNLQSTTVNTNGASAVTVTKNGVAIKPQAIWWMHSLSVGSGSVAAGNIDLILSGTTTVVERISPSGNMSLSARTCVPAGYTGYLYDLFGNAIAGNQDIRARATVSKLSRTLLNGVYNFQGVISLKEGDSSPRMLPHLVMPEKTRVKISSFSSLAAGQAEASLSMIFIKN